jgi:hypothetical protein
MVKKAAGGLKNSPTNLTGTPIPGVPVKFVGKNNPPIDVFLVN